MHVTMNWESRFESAVLVSTAVLCIIIVWNVAKKLRSIFPFRVNCWFCNGNTWVRFPERNHWTCPTCEQYNGFTKDGDYNQPLPTTTEPTFKTPSPARRSPVSNGLCRMCNINQQLKVAQLANFVPISEANFDKEIMAYKLQLEKAYKLCTRCRKVLHAKLRREKEILLGSKLLESRSTNRNNDTEKQNIGLKKFKYFAMTLTLTLIISITTDCYKYIMNYKSTRTTVLHFKQVVYSLVERLITVLKSKAFHTFPFLHDYEDISYPVFIEYYSKLSQWIPPITVDYLSKGNNIQQILGGVGCLTQILCHMLNKNIVKYQTVTDTLWTVLLVSLITKYISTPGLLAIKLSAATALFIIYQSVNLKPGRSIFASAVISPKRMKSLTGENNESWSKDSSSELETDDDVSLSQYGINNSASSNETKSPKKSFVNGKVNSSFTKQPVSLWSVPTVKSTFNCSSPFHSSISQTSFASQKTAFTKPEFSSYQKMDINDSDSDLDEGINGLQIGTSPKKGRPSRNIFSIKKFDNLSPRFAVPSSQQRPLISPSKLGQGMSWVAGGYWGDEGSRGLYDVAGSRSSSQSSGFESQASSFQRNAFSQLPSRAESVCSEFDRTSIFSDSAAQKFSIVPNAFQQTQLGRLRSPVHPQMRYDGHIHIPLPMVPHKRTHSSFMDYQEVSSPNSRVFPAANRGSGLIKLPHIST